MQAACRPPPGRSAPRAGGGTRRPGPLPAPGPPAHRDDVDEGGLAGVLQPHQGELHLLLPEERAEPIQQPGEQRQHGCGGAAATTGHSLENRGRLRRLSALLYRQDIARGFREGLRQALSAYGEDEGKADALDALQRTLGCCGVESYRDWLASPWALQQNASVPLSCCRARRGCSLSSAGTRGLHPEGCFGKVSAFVSSNMFCIATAALGLAVLQVVGIVLACLMAVRVPAHITALH